MRATPLLAHINQDAVLAEAFARLETACFPLALNGRILDRCLDVLNCPTVGGLHDVAPLNEAFLSAVCGWHSHTDLFE